MNSCMAAAQSNKTITTGATPPPRFTVNAVCVQVNTGKAGDPPPLSAIQASTHISGNRPSTLIATPTFIAISTGAELGSDDSVEKNCGGKPPVSISFP
jgi:hypothetical protein